MYLSCWIKFQRLGQKNENDKEIGKEEKKRQKKKKKNSRLSVYVQN